MTNQSLAAITGFVLAFIGINLNDRLRRGKPNKNALRLSIQGIEVNDISEIIRITSKNSSRIDFNSLIIEDNSIANKSSVILSILQNSFEDTNLMVRKLNEKFPYANMAIIDINNV